MKPTLKIWSCFWHISLLLWVLKWYWVINRISPSCLLISNISTLVDKSINHSASLVVNTFINSCWYIWYQKTLGWDSLFNEIENIETTPCILYIAQQAYWYAGCSILHDLVTKLGVHIPHDFLLCFRFTHLKHIQHGDSYERYPPKKLCWTKNGGYRWHSVAWTCESPVVCACLKSGACEIAAQGGWWVFRARALRVNKFKRRAKKISKMNLWKSRLAA